MPFLLHLGEKQVGASAADNFEQIAFALICRCRLATRTNILFKLRSLSSIRQQDDPGMLSNGFVKGSAISIVAPLDRDGAITLFS